DLVVPVQLALVDQDPERGGGDRLAGRASGEDGVGVDARVLTELADAIASRKRDLATFDDRDGHARHAVLFQYRFDMRVESGWRCGKGRSGEQGSGHEDRGAQAMP